MNIKNASAKKILGAFAAAGILAACTSTVANNTDFGDCDPDDLECIAEYNANQLKNSDLDIGECDADDYECIAEYWVGKSDLGDIDIGDCDSDDAKSSSSKVEVKSSETVAVSSSAIVIESSATVNPTSSSWNGQTVVEEVNNDSTTVDVGGDAMEEVNDDESDELDSLRQELEDPTTNDPEGFEKDDDGEFNYEDFDFDNNDYFCFTGEGDWLRIDFNANREELKKTGLPFLWNGHANGLKRKYLFRFENECAAVYIRRK